MQETTKDIRNPADVIQTAVDIGSSQFLKGFLTGQLVLVVFAALLIQFLFLRGPLESRREERRMERGRQLERRRRKLGDGGDQSHPKENPSSSITNTTMATMAMTTATMATPTTAAPSTSMRRQGSVSTQAGLGNTPNLSSSNSSGMFSMTATAKANGWLITFGGDCVNALLH